MRKLLDGVVSGVEGRVKYIEGEADRRREKGRRRSRLEGERDGLRAGVDSAEGKKREACSSGGKP